jgi:hypothetical protein
MITPTAISPGAMCEWSSPCREFGSGWAPCGVMLDVVIASCNSGVT